MAKNKVEAQNKIKRPPTQVKKRVVEAAAKRKASKTSSARKKRT